MRTALSRKQFLQMAAAAGALAQTGILTARQVIERIQKNVGVPWRTETVDTFKAGDPETPVKGIATTCMATFDVLKRASAAGRNLVITHEPTFYNHLDATKDFADDPVYLAKQEFIRKNALVVWRFHDHWHARRPDGIQAGMTRALGWEKYQSAGNPRHYVLPGSTLEKLAGSIRKRLGIRAMRVVGDPRIEVSRVALLPGAGGLAGLVHTLARPEIDAVIVGETREWEGVEYAQDTIASGKKKGLLILGHVISEEGGMRECADWLKGFVSEVPVEFVPAGEPFWRPGAKDA